MNTKWKSFIISILIPLCVGFLSSFLSKDAYSSFETLQKPFLSPPEWLFPLVWSILYILMGIASYLIYISEDQNKNKALLIYIIQLFFNFLWSILFFNYNLYFISFIWIIILWVLIIYTIILFYPINKYASYLLIPYLLWVTFASYLNYAIAILNK